ncbi:MAG: hypothetical protein LBP33_08340 [Candidatus Adiutrix sp.]|jgi:hypothetical protein|nr:hypothetical protein [Candidatus Adiutrix sp.]
MPVVTPAPVAPSVVAPIEADSSAKSAGDEERRRRAAASGRSDTNLTGGLGVQETARTGGKKLLGG